MRLKKSLTEGYQGINDIGEMNYLIGKDCKKYLGLIKGKDPLYRGLGSTVLKMGIKSVRKDRHSRGMDQEEADYLNNWLQKSGHARRDKSILVTADKSLTLMFGMPYYVFPLGQMKKYTWVEAGDMNIASGNGWSNHTINAWYKISNRPKDFKFPEHMTDHSKRMLEPLRKPFEDHFHTNTGWDKAISNEYEMWIECDKYYFVDATEYQWDSQRQEIV